MTENKIIIRELKKEDFNQWLPLWEGYNTFYEREIPPKVTNETYRRFIDPTEPMHALVALTENKIIGIVHFLFHRNTSMINDVCYLQDLFTVKELRNSGIGKKLILAVYEKARERQSPRVYWQTQETNHVAQILYTKLATRTDFIIYRKLFSEFI